MSGARFLGVFVASLAACVSFAKCAMPSTLHIKSQNGKHSLIFEPDGRFKLNGVAGQVRISGHHQRAFLSNDGKRFVIADRYDGITVFDGFGQVLERFDGNDLCWERTDAWTCHPEGEWYGEDAVLAGDKVRFDVGMGPDAILSFGSPDVSLAFDRSQEGGIKLAAISSIAALGGLVFWIGRRRSPAKYGRRIT
ncbi:MAG TPA: hypothetical protein PLX06_14855 [Fimbriimonadaceae bacterium]|nr:hypothetical protein [Fimbriimonadaceae bacterium]